MTQFQLKKQQLALRCFIWIDLPPVCTSLLPPVCTLISTLVTGTPHRNLKVRRIPKSQRAASKIEPFEMLYLLLCAVCFSCSALSDYRERGSDLMGRKWKERGRRELEREETDSHLWSCCASFHLISLDAIQGLCTLRHTRGVCVYVCVHLHTQTHTNR